MTESERWWVNAQFLCWRRRWRVMVRVARLDCSLENSSWDFPRDARVEWPGGTVSYPGPVLVLEWWSGAGQDTCHSLQTLTAPHTSISSHWLHHSTTPPLHSSTGPPHHTETDRLLRGNLVELEFTKLSFISVVISHREIVHRRLSDLIKVWSKLFLIIRRVQTRCQVWPCGGLSTQYYPVRQW